jgi:hypothetical protein
VVAAADFLPVVVGQQVAVRLVAVRLVAVCLVRPFRQVAHLLDGEVEYRRCDLERPLVAVRLVAVRLVRPFQQVAHLLDGEVEYRRCDLERLLVAVHPAHAFAEKKLRFVQGTIELRCHKLFSDMSRCFKLLFKVKARILSHYNSELHTDQCCHVIQSSLSPTL